MARTDRVFISDVHLSSDPLYDSNVAWYDPAAHRHRFLGFLQKHVIEQADNIKDLVILGDLLDDWVCPADQEPPTWDDIIAANSQEFALFQKSIERGINLFFIHGNHDFDLPSRTLEKALPGIKVVRAYKGAGRTHAEHGHHYTLFNRPDRRNDPAFGRPIGYYISRLAASHPDSPRSLRSIASYLDDIIEAALPMETIFSAIIEAMAEWANVDKIVMPGKREVSVDTIKQRYKNLSAQHNIGLGHIAALAWQEGNLGKVADSLCKQWGFNVVLFGHTHGPKLDKDWFFVEDRVYANTGTWCEEEANCVILEKYPIKSEVRVHLVDVDQDGNIQGKQTCKLD